MGSGAGMAFTGPGRANNQLSGWFNVLEAEYNPDGSVRSFAVDFRQYDENSVGAWNQGSIRYNSTIPVPEPTAAAGLLIAAMLLRRHRRPADAAANSDPRRTTSGDSAVRRIRLIRVRYASCAQPRGRGSRRADSRWGAFQT